jgi:hypothetical protein
MELDPTISSDACGDGNPLRPRILYTYRTINDHLRDVLIHKHLWASNPLSFNDPFDCAIPALNTATPDEAIACVESLLGMDNFSPEHQAMARQEAAQGRIVNPERIEMAWQKTLREMGIVCFTERPDNLLMWAHYASKHEGVCLGFEGLSARLDVQHALYAKTLPRLKLIDLLPPRNLEATKVRLRSKSCHWAYEREWRFIVGKTKFSSDDDPRRKVPFSPDELRRVIFGCRIAPQKRHQIMVLLKDWPTPLYFYQSEPHRSRFAVSIRPIFIHRPCRTD